MFTQSGIFTPWKGKTLFHVFVLVLTSIGVYMCDGNIICTFSFTIRGYMYCYRYGWLLNGCVGFIVAHYLSLYQQVLCV